MARISKEKIATLKAKVGKTFTAEFLDDGTAAIEYWCKVLSVNDDGTFTGRLDDIVDDK